jgi:hypothetical protein
LSGWASFLLEERGSEGHTWAACKRIGPLYVRDWEGAVGVTGDKRFGSLRAHSGRGGSAGDQRGRGERGDEGDGDGQRRWKRAGWPPTVLPAANTRSSPRESLIKPALSSQTEYSACWEEVRRWTRSHCGHTAVTLRFGQRSLLHRLQVRAEATVRCAGLRRAQVAPRQEMPNLAIALRECCVTRHPEPFGVRRLDDTRHTMVAYDGECSCAGWGAMVRQLRHPNRAWAEFCE